MKYGLEKAGVADFVCFEKSSCRAVEVQSHIHPGCPKNLQDYYVFLAEGDQSVFGTP